ncbi:hypothetical protein FM119_06915 [Mycetocola reblochoni REB411]|uniref:Uncharacterized protein n=1 Tax=Mycetocola reblochoni REB411 TaxID=1255698 RepID=A0A1R4JDG4_9MICO|nr:hypothetical protein FM119_06915 [Mycetocola reblochoni REB411]
MRVRASIAVAVLLLGLILAASGRYTAGIVVCALGAALFASATRATARRVRGNMRRR